MPPKTQIDFSTRAQIIALKAHGVATSTLVDWTGLGQTTIDRMYRTAMARGFDPKAEKPVLRDAHITGAEAGGTTTPNGGGGGGSGSETGRDMPPVTPKKRKRTPTKTPTKKDMQPSVGSSGLSGGDGPDNGVQNPEQGYQATAVEEYVPDVPAQ
ncbi:hypothetical protein BDY21DRAFT_373236 [Lineolata rhizophorae]|uniref:Uncharacterized protein n=1 Tax=Lineolata rhizophorae TaxID=578093 RepID=A0A6A6NVT6_9PEZI|nr:hypothetical protein BDY21DRAFT_373236 [Lineolata rhizophorae]